MPVILSIYFNAKTKVNKVIINQIIKRLPFLH